MLKLLNERIQVGRSLIFLCTDGVSYSIFNDYPYFALGAYFIDVGYYLLNQL